MALYELSKEQVAQLIQIINATNFKGSDSHAVCDLIHALQKQPTELDKPT